MDRPFAVIGDIEREFSRYDQDVSQAPGPLVNLLDFGPLSLSPSS
jgi:hypothetical protein